MGKIKTRLIKRTAEELLEQDIEFKEDFEENKKILGNAALPGKKIRNQIAGLIARIKKQERVDKPEILKNK